MGGGVGGSNSTSQQKNNVVLTSKIKVTHLVRFDRAFFARCNSIRSVLRDVHRRLATSDCLVARADEYLPMIVVERRSNTRRTFYPSFLDEDRNTRWVVDESSTGEPVAMANERTRSCRVVVDGVVLRLSLFQQRDQTRSVKLIYLFSRSTPLAKRHVALVDAAVMGAGVEAQRSSRH
jgi:hypothetical protein